MGIKFLRKSKVMKWHWIILIMWSIPSTVYAQFGIFQHDSLGFGLWFSLVNVNIDPAPSTVPDRVKAYTEILPPSFVGVGLGGGASWKNFGLDLGLNRTEINVGKSADVQQNEDPSDDLFVIKARRLNQSWSILHHPFPFFYYGYGENQGRFEFGVRLPDDRRQVRRVGYFHKYYLLGMVNSFEWVPRPTPLYLLITLYVKVPLEAESFSGKLYGVGITGAVP